MTPGTPGSLYLSAIERQQVEADEAEVVRAVRTAEFVDPRFGCGPERSPLFGCKVDLIGLHGLTHEPSEHGLPIERPALRHRVHVPTLDVEADLEQQVEIRARVYKRPGRLRRSRPRDRAGHVVEQRDDLAHV